MPGNSGRTRAEGVGAVAAYGLPATRFGRFTTRAAATLINSQTLRTRPDLPQVETVGLYEIPRWRGDASLLWTGKQSSAALNVNYIGGFQDTAPSWLLYTSDAADELTGGNLGGCVFC